MITLDDLRRFAVSRSLFMPTTLERAIGTLGFVQADPIRAPARAQDLMLRPRVDGYRAGDLERLYSALSVEEDVFINYGFVTRSLQALMHPRTVASLWPTARNKRAQAVLAFVAECGTVHPRDVDAHFSHGTVKNYWGGSSNATTHLLEAMHYKGLLRVARREGGVRIYAVHEHGPGPIGSAARQARIDAIVDLVVREYAPLPAASLSYVVSRLRYAVPQWHGDLRCARERAKLRLSHTRIEGNNWYWPVDERPSSGAPPDVVRLLAPFDPVVFRAFSIATSRHDREVRTTHESKLAGLFQVRAFFQRDVVPGTEDGGQIVTKGGDESVVDVRPEVGMLQVWIHPRAAEPSGNQPSNLPQRGGVSSRRTGTA